VHLLRLLIYAELHEVTEQIAEAATVHVRHLLIAERVQPHAGIAAKAIPARQESERQEAGRAREGADRLLH
jgi:hypothetical protein